MIVLSGAERVDQCLADANNRLTSHSLTLEGGLVKDQHGEVFAYLLKENIPDGISVTLKPARSLP